MDKSSATEVFAHFACTRGPRFISYMALRIEASEKAIETIGIEGRHSRLPSSSSIQVLETSLFQGKTNTPLSIKKPRRTT